MTRTRIAMDEAGWLRALLEQLLGRPSERTALSSHAAEARLAELMWREGGLVGASQTEEADGPDRSLDASWMSNTARVLSLVLAHRPAGTPEAAPHDLASILAVALGEVDVAVRLMNPEVSRDESLEALAGALARRTYRLGNPAGGLPLQGVVSAIDARHLMRLGLVLPLPEARLRRHAARAARARSELLALAIESIAHLLGDATTPATVQRQVRHLGLVAPARRQLLRQLQAPRAPAALVRSVPRRLRGLFIEQLVLAVLLGPGWSASAEEQLSAACRAAELPELLVASARARASAMMLAHPRAVAALTAREMPSGWQETLDGVLDGLADTTDALANEAMDRRGN